MRSKKLYELIAIMSKYRTRLVKLLEGSDDFSLPINMQSKFRTYYNIDFYGAWPSYMPIPDVETKFSFCGNSCMIAWSVK